MVTILRGATCSLVITWIMAGVATAQIPPFQLQWGSAGSGPGQFSEPWGIAVNHLGNYVYVVDRGNHRIQKFTSQGAFITQWGHAGPGAGSFAGPEAIAVSETGDVFVADHDNQLVQRFDSNGSFLGQWTTIVRSVAAAGGLIYVTDDFSGVIKVFDVEGNLLQSHPTRLGGDNHFSAPWGIALDESRNIYIAEYGNSRIKRIANGSVASVTGGLSGWDLQWLACDVAGSIFTVTSSDISGGITVFSSSGYDIASLSGGGAAPGQFKRPRGIAVDRDGHIYIADSGNNRVQKFGFGPTAARSTTWARLKQLYR